MKGVASDTLNKRGPDGASGALGQFRGHLFERLDAKVYNLRNARLRRQLVLRQNPHAPGYDATRFIDGQFAGGVQYKLSAGGLNKAVEKINARKPGSATRATLRVPKDQAHIATRQAAGRIRVNSSDVSRRVVNRRSNAGLRQLSRKGSAAVSPAHQLGRSVGFAVIVGAAVGTLWDARRLYRHEMSAQEFATSRAMDAAEHGASQLAGVAAINGVMVAAQTLAGGTGVIAGAAGFVASSTVVVPLATCTMAGIAATYAIRPLRRRTQNWAARRAKARAARSALAPAPDTAEQMNSQTSPPPSPEETKISGSASISDSSRPRAPPFPERLRRTTA